MASHFAWAHGKIEQYCEALPWSSDSLAEGPSDILAEARRIYHDSHDRTFQAQYGFQAVAAACIFISCRLKAKFITLTTLLDSINSIDDVNVPLVSFFQVLWKIEYRLESSA